MVGLSIIFAVVGLAWMAGLEGVVIIVTFILLLLIGITLTTLAGVSKRRNSKQKYHPAH